MLFLVFMGMEFIKFPQKKNSIFASMSDINNRVNVAASGSIGYRDSNGKCIQTNPNETLHENEDMDWCSNIAKTKNKEDNPWISFQIKNKMMKLNGYSVRSGCCRYICCCLDDRNVDACCCELYSFSLQGSNDNKTWKTIHKVEKDPKFWNCKVNTYEFPMTEAYTFVRFVMDDQKSYCERCMALNQIEFYGETIDSLNPNFSDLDNDGEESVSIIGKLRKESY